LKRSLGSKGEGFNGFYNLRKGKVNEEGKKGFIKIIDLSSLINV